MVVGMGRNPVPEALAKSVRMNTPMSKSEHAEITAAAEAAMERGETTSVAAWTRQVLLAAARASEPAKPTRTKRKT